MATLWEKLSNEHREMLKKCDLETSHICPKYWESKLSSKQYEGELNIYCWTQLRNDLGFNTIDETYENTFNNEEII